MFNKKDSDLYSTPFAIPFTYTPLQIDQMAQSKQVQPANNTPVAYWAIEEAVQLYLEVYGQQFTGEKTG